MRKQIKKNFKKENSGITLIALVVTIIILLILAVISIGMLTGNNGILKQARNAKSETISSSSLEQIKIETLASFDKDGYLSLSKLTTNLQSIGATVSGSSFPVTVTLNGASYTINEDGIIESVGIQNEEETDCQWIIVADNDYNGVLSLGDEVAPLIDSVKDEHFYVLSNNGDSVKLITKLSVDNVTNSQSSSASGVTYDMAYCDLEGVEHDWIMPTWAVKTVEYSDDESGNPDPSTAYEIHYDGTEKGKVHCPGTYTKNYGLRLKNAGLKLMDFSSTGCSYIQVPEVDDFGLGASTDNHMFEAIWILGNRSIWGNIR